MCSDTIQFLWGMGMVHSFPVIPTRQDSSQKGCNDSCCWQGNPSYRRRGSKLKSKRKGN